MATNEQAATYHPRTSRTQQIATFIGIFLPFAGLIVAIYSLWGWGVSWSSLSMLVVMYLATGFGITIGYHRLFTHRSFETPKPIKFMFAVMGSMSVQGPLLKWVAMHRRHHQHSDGVEDPHSPNGHGGGVWGVLRGFWHAHVGWMFFADHPELSRYVQDLSEDRMLSFVSRNWALWSFLGLVIPTVVVGLITQSWTGAFLGLLWGGLVRIFLVHHATWSINSVCHIWGRRPFASNDLSTNNFLCGLVGLGEGWHNNHHAFPTSARHGLRWWQPDFSYWVIRSMEAVGLAWKVRVPTATAIVNKLAAKTDDVSGATTLGEQVVRRTPLSASTPSESIPA